MLPFGRIQVQDPPDGDGALLNMGITNTALVLGVVLSWLFAERAARPRWQQALAAALTVDLTAVLLGAFLVAAQVSLAGGVAEPVGATWAVGLIGLLFLGLPALVLVFLPVIAWVVLVQLAARALGQSEPHPPAVEPVPTWPQP